MKKILQSCHDDSAFQYFEPLRIEIVVCFLSLNLEHEDEERQHSCQRNTRDHQEREICPIRTKLDGSRVVVV